MDRATEIARTNLIKSKYGAAKVWMVENKDLLNFSGITKNYFGRSAQWIMQRLHKYEVHGKQVSFKEEEYKTLSDALRDLAYRLNKAADEIDKAEMEE